MSQKNCGPVELATQSLGQTSAYTPIQLVMASIAATNGGTVAAPLVGEIIEQSLNYLGVERDYENQIEKNLRWFLDTPTYKVENYIGKTKKEIKASSFYRYIFYGRVIK